MASANQVDFKIAPSDQFSVYSPSTRSDKIITYFTLLSRLRGDILVVSQEEDPNDIVSAYYSNTGGVQTLHLIKADGSEVTASQLQQIISGTVNYIPKFTSSNDIGDSQIFDDGTNVGIGTTSMTHKLQLGTGGVFADYFQLDTTYSNGFVVGAISWDQDAGTADVGLSGSLKLKIGQDDVWYVKNQTGSSIAKGTAVYANGTLGASGRITIAPMIADGTIPARFFLGIVAETIANGADGYVLARGKIRQISTLAYNEGDVLWVSPTTAGALTATEPTAPNLKLPVAFVVYKASNGVLAVRATTGQRIADASDVDYTGAVDNSFLVYDSATGVWVDEAVGIFKTIAVAGQSDVVADTYTDTLTLVAGTNVTITTNASTDTITINSTDQFVGTVTSVDMSVPTGFAISGNPITTSGTLALAFATGYSLPTDATQANWTAAYNDKINSASFDTSTGVITLTQQDAGTVTVDIDGRFILLSEKGAANGVATLDAGGKLPVSQLPSSVFEYKGTWNAATNTPTLANGTGDPGDVYRCTVAGTVNFGAGPITFEIGDLVIYDGAEWQKSDSTDAVTSVNGYTGTVVLTTSDISEGTNLYFTTARARQSLSAGTAISYDNSTGVITNSAPDQIVAITAGTGTSVTGTYPNFTISATGTGGTVTSVDLTAGTGISVSGGPITTSGSITVTNTAPDQIVSLTGAGTTSVSGTYPNFTITSNDQYVGTVTSIATTAPITGGTITTTGTIGITQSGTSSDGYLSSTDWNTFNSKEPALTKGNLTETTSSVLTITGGTNAVIGTGTTIAVSQSGAASDGYLSSADWNTFNAKEPALTKGDLTETTSSVLTITGGTGAVIGSGTSIQVSQAGSSSSGYLSSTDWNTFNSKSGAAFKTISVAGQSDIVADAADDTLTIAAGTGVTLTTNASTDTLTITNSAPDQTVVLTAGTGISTSGTYPNFTITNTDPDQVVSLTGAGTTSITGTYPSFTITSNDQYTGTVTSVDLTAGTGISVSGGPITSSGSITVTNTDTGSAQNIFKTIAVSGQSDIVADSNNDTLTVAAGSGVTITTDATTDTITISATGSGGTVTSIATSAPITGGTITSTGTIGITQATTSTDGYLSSTDWNTFNAKEPALTKGNLTETTSSILTITGGTNAVIGSGTTIAVAQAGASSSGYLSSADWNTFNNKGTGSVTSVDLTAGTGITVSGGPITTSGSITVTNDDRGSSQNIFKNINVTTTEDWNASVAVWEVNDGSWSSGIDQDAIVADSNNDTLYIESISGISITTDASTDSMFFENIDKGSSQNIFKNISVSGQSTIVADSNDDTLNIAAGTGVTITTDDSTDTLTITNDDRGSSQNIFKNIAVSGQSTVVADSNDDTLTLVAGTGISITTDASTDSVTIANTNTSIPCFSAYSSTGVTLTTNGAYYDFELNNETVKDSSVFTHSTSTNSDEITILSAGTYEITYSAAMINANSTVNDAATVTVYIYKNGSSLVTALNTAQAVAFINTSGYNYYNQISNSYIVSLAANDVIKLVVYAAFQGGAGTSYDVRFGYLGNNNVTIKKLG